MRGICLFIVVIFMSPATACPFLGPFRAEDKAKAQAVFIGKAVRYERNGEKGQVTFEVTKTIRGEKRTKWIVTIATNTNVGIPNNFRQFRECYGESSEVGIENISGDSSVAVQGPCNPPYILSLTDAPKDSMSCRSF